MQQSLSYVRLMYFNFLRSSAKITCCTKNWVKARLISIVSQPLSILKKKPGLKTNQITFRKNVSIFSQNNFQTLAQNRLLHSFLQQVSICFGSLMAKFDISETKKWIKKPVLWKNMVYFQITNFL